MPRDVPRRWRLFADAVVVALGLNVWLSLLLVPGLFVGAFRHSGAMVALAAVALVPLAVGVVRRSPLLLLLTYPAALLVPLAWDPRVATEHLRGPLAFAVVAGGLVAYLLGVSFLETAAAPPAPPERMRRLSSAAAPLPARWRRRFRLYAALAVLSMVFPLVLITAVSFTPTHAAYLRELYEDRSRSLMTVLQVGVLGFWLSLFAAYFVGPLRLHRTGDRGLLHELAALRAEARAGTPRPSFYLAVTLALAFMGLLVLLRYR